MKSKFDQNIDRRNTHCAKWDILMEENLDPKVLPMWVADMDFKVPEEVLEALKKRLEHPIFGYTRTPDSYFEALIQWYKKHYDFEPKEEEIIPAPGVVPGINQLIRCFTEIGDGIVIQTPVYHQFQEQINQTRRKVVVNPLICENGHYKMDYDHLDEQLKKAKMMILCSPHNPVGRLWKKEELQKVGDLCKKHQVLLISDEIHQDIRRKGKKHFVFNTVDPSFKEFTFLCTAPNKTFNIAGFKTANTMIQNPKLRKKMEEFLESIAYKGHTIFGNIAQESAYRYGEKWWREMNEYIDENIAEVLGYFKEHIPEIRIQSPEAGYLLWLDCSKLGLTGEELQQFFIEEAKVRLNQGQVFGEEYGDHMRMNIATTRARCMKACEQIRKAVEKRR
ncbi:MAG: MalY/PatB family protein [Tissierellia bacterium]|nr:MalY/PatB family protein [Tissierellia bacterium]